MELTDEKILIYTEDTHYGFTLCIMEILLRLDYKNLFLATYENKYYVLKKTRPDLIEKIRFINLKNLPSFKNNPMIRIYNAFHNYQKISGVINNENIKKIIFLESNEVLFKIFNSIKSFRNAEKILVVHNLNDFISYKIIKKFFFEYKLRKSTFFDRIFFKKMNKFVVLNETLKQNFELYFDKKVYVLPFRIAENQIIKARSNFLLKRLPILKFTVPGFVHCDKKNYKEIIDSFKKFSKDDYILTFLGKVVDYNVVRYAIENGVNVKYYIDYVSEEEFRKEMIESHFLLGIISDKLPYGLFKTSGIEFEGPSFGIPTIVNNENIISEKGIFIYTDNLQDTLKKIFEDFKDGLYYEKYGKPAYEKMFSNTLENYLDIMKRILEE
ncbi:glycosyltransferase [Thermosipho sp. 1070]|uniref:glycosyltransferase n=1 Tax=Thermosipho sp. 1070 TaxID=1437364 RepID=UPI0009493621|nr:glycosyltransferase [Thermosipho sp. 1070]ANQ54609.1 hypothetical protein Y592_04215 [Thermosipho sp. 1070]